MAYAILRTSKLKSWGNISGSAAHTYRHKGMAPNADPLRMGRNKVLVGRSGEAVEDIRNRISAITDKPRKNGVLCVEHLLTASPEFFEKLTSKQVDAWARKNLQFLAKTYGKQNVVHAVLHLDESTPHIVAYVVPEKDGKLNCRAYLGGREKLTKLQTGYANDMRSMGLERGVEGSKARHRTVKNFYASLDRIERLSIAELRKIEKPIRPPDLTLSTMLSKEKRDVEVKDWEKQETARTAKVVKAAGNALVAAKTLREDIGVLKSQNNLLVAENEALRASISDLREMLDLPKDEISRLRKLDVSMVAERLGHMDEIRKGENAIDLTKRIGGFDYQQAVAWLHHEFGSLAAAAAVREQMEVSTPERPFTKAENTIKKAVHAQLDGLGCDSFRVSLIAPEGKGAPYLPGKSRDGEKFYSRKDIEAMIPYLRYENNVGRKSVLITPMDDHAYYVLLDDMRVKLDDLKAKGFQPCMVQRTSWESMQAVFKVPQKDVDRRAVIDVFNGLNQDIGDPSITGLRHPFRLAGFRNFKDKHERDGKFPFVALVETVNRFCRKTWDLVVQRQAQIELAERKTQEREHKLTPGRSFTR